MKIHITKRVAHMLCIKVIVISILLSVIGLTKLNAQTLYVKEKSGTQTAFTVANIKKLTFSGGEMTVNPFAENSKIYLLTGIRYLNFKDLTTNVFFTEKQETEKLILFPNPVKDLLTFNYSASSDIKLQVEIIASDGKVVFHQQIIRQSLADITTINVSPLPDGLYLFLLSDGKMVHTNKFLKIN